MRDVWNVDTTCRNDLVKLDLSGWEVCMYIHYYVLLCVYGRGMLYPSVMFIEKLTVSSSFQGLLLIFYYVR